MKSRKAEELHARQREAIRMANIDFFSLRPTFIELVMREMNVALERIKVSVILPAILSERKVVVRVLTGTKYEPAIKLLDDFTRRRDIILKERRQPLMDVGIIRIIDFFQRNKEIYTLFPMFMNKMADKEQRLIKTFEKLMKVALTHLERDSAAQIQLERTMQRAFKERRHLKANIYKFEQKIEKYDLQRSVMNMKVKEYLNNIKNSQREKKKQNDEKMAHETDLYQRAVMANTKASQEKQLELSEELEKVRFDDEKLKKDSAKSIKNAREETNKLQIQLETIIKKYDTVMLEKYVENMELDDKLKEAQQQLDDFMVTYHQEELIYNEIVVKREKEEWRRKQTAILRYMMNRAARKIQRYWRAWRKAKSRSSRKKKK